MYEYTAPVTQEIIKIIEMIKKIILFQKYVGNKDSRPSSTTPLCRIIDCTFRAKLLRNKGVMKTIRIKSLCNIRPIIIDEIYGLFGY